jgi:hypothetical protein
MTLQMGSILSGNLFPRCRGNTVVIESVSPPWFLYISFLIWRVIDVFYFHVMPRIGSQGHNVKFGFELLQRHIATSHCDVAAIRTLTKQL